MFQCLERRARQPKTSCDLERIKRVDTIGNHAKGLALLYNPIQVHVIGKQKASHVKWYVDYINKNQRFYEHAVVGTSVPWEVLGVLHMMEAGGDFSKQVLNGEKWRKKTKLVPRGLGPFNDFVGAFHAALGVHGFNNLPIEWDIGGTLYFLEGWNGFGYKAKGRRSPYLWAYSNHQKPGKYIKDGVYDPKAISLQVGCAIMLKKLQYRP